MDITFILTGYNTRYLKRIIAAKNMGHNIHIQMFERDPSSPFKQDFLENADTVTLLGKANDESYLFKIKLLFFPLYYLLKYFKSREQVLYFFDVPLIPLASFLSLFSKNIIMEIGDLLHLNHGKLIESFTNRLFFYLSKRARFFVFTSKGFLHYFDKNNIPISKYEIIENKPTDYSYSSIKTTNGELTQTIGYVGEFRYPSAFLDLVNHLPDWHFELFGNSRHMNIWDKIIDQNYNISYHEPFKKEDLDNIYSKMNYVYCYYVGFNEQYLTPNKLWEAILFETPILVNKNSYLGTIVQELDIGLAVDNFNEDIEFLLENNFTRYLQSIKKLKNELGAKLFDETSAILLEVLASNNSSNHANK